MREIITKIPTWKMYRNIYNFSLLVTHSKFYFFIIQKYICVLVIFRVKISKHVSISSSYHAN